MSKHQLGPFFDVYVENTFVYTFNSVAAALDYATRHVYLSNSYGTYEEIVKGLISGKTFVYSYGFNSVTIIPRNTHMIPLLENASELLSSIKNFVARLEELNEHVPQHVYAAIAKAEGK